MVKYNVLYDGANAVVDSEPRFIPGIKREEDGVSRKCMDTLGKDRAYDGWPVRMGVLNMVVKEFGTELVEDLVNGRYCSKPGRK